MWHDKITHREKWEWKKNKTRLHVRININKGDYSLIEKEKSIYFLSDVFKSGVSIQSKISVGVWCWSEIP